MARFGVPQPFNLDAVMSGRPLFGWQKRKARQTREILLRAGVPAEAVNSGAFDSMDPQQATLWSLQHGSDTEAYDKTMGDRNAALEMLSREVGDIPEDLAKKYLGEGASLKNLGGRIDTLREEIMRRNALQRSSYEQSQRNIAESRAAQLGRPMTTGDLSAIGNRGATLFGRQLGTDLAGLTANRESVRQNAIGQLSNILTGGYESQQAAPQVQAPQMTFRLGRLTVPVNSGGGNFGANYPTRRSRKPARFPSSGLPSSAVAW